MENGKASGGTIVTEFLSNLRTKRTEVNRRLRDIPTVQKALAGELDSGTYATYLDKIARSYSPHSPRVMCLAAGRCSDNQRQLAGYFMSHAAEEAGHDLWAGHDLTQIRGPQLNDRIDPYALCQAMIGYTYYLAMVERPSALLGWMYILEAVGADLGPDAVRGLRMIQGLPLEFVGGHAEADVNHIYEMEEVLNSIGDHAEQQAILKAAEVSAELYVGMFLQLELDAVATG